MNIKWETIAAVAGTLAIVFLMAFSGGGGNDDIEFAPVASVAPAEAVAGECANEMWVHVAGAVVNPGVYRVSGPARVIEAIDLAGGPAEGADLDRINLAALLSDGQRLFVPAASCDADEVVNVNDADARTLEQVPGIGPALAGRIIAYREQHGPFGTLDDLARVSGIGPATIDRLREYVTVY